MYTVVKNFVAMVLHLDEGSKFAERNFPGCDVEDYEDLYDKYMSLYGKYDILPLNFDDYYYQESNMISMSGKNLKGDKLDEELDCVLVLPLDGRLTMLDALNMKLSKDDIVSMFRSKYGSLFPDDYDYEEFIYDFSYAYETGNMSHI